MAYYTEYTIYVDYPNGYDGEIIENVTTLGYGNLPIRETMMGQMKWYEHEQDMINFSKKHPELEFTLVGEGEERDDVWKKYFKNGVMINKDTATIIMAPDSAIDFLAFRISSLFGGQKESEIKNEINKFLSVTKW